MKNIILLLMLVIGISSCGTALQKKSLQVEPGMTKDDVVKIMGYPGNKQFKGVSEAWQYCSTGIGSDRYYVVWFTNSSVTGMTTYSGYESGMCDKFYRTVNWEDRPNKTIEIRNR